MTPNHPPCIPSNITMMQIYAPPTTPPAINYTPPNPNTDSRHTPILPSTYTLHNLPMTSHTSSVIPTHTNSLPHTQYIYSISPIPMNDDTSPTFRHNSPDIITLIPPLDTPPISTLHSGLITQYNDVPIPAPHPDYPDPTQLYTNMKTRYTPHIIPIHVLHMIPRTMMTTPFTPRNPPHLEATQKLPPPTHPNPILYLTSSVTPIITHAVNPSPAHPLQY